jgi:signal transduction histidine kinase
MNTHSLPALVLPTNDINRLRRLYMLALGAIALMAIIGQAAIQVVLHNDETNARIINIAGRQRMLSQKLCKLATQLAFVEHTPKPATLKEFQSSYLLWQHSHYGLQRGDTALHIPAEKNSPMVKAMFAKLEPVCTSMDSLCQNIPRIAADTALRPLLRETVSVLLVKADEFLPQMNTIVFQYDEEFRVAVVQLQLLEAALFILTIVVLGIEAAFVFRPAVQQLRQTFDALGAKNQELSASNDMLIRQQEVLEEQAIELETNNTKAQEQNLELERHRGSLQEKMFELEHLYRQVQEAQRVQTEFLANLSHELRTPMAAIIGFTEILLSDFTTEGGKPFGKRVLHSANVLLAMLNDLIDFASIEAGIFEIDRELQPLEPVITNICVLIRFEAVGKGLVLNCFIAPEVPPLLSFDAWRIRQILFNLLANAVKFTESGSVTLRTLFDTANNTLIFEIEDTGIGIAPEDQARVFEPFVQQDGSPTRKYGGIGIGLTFVKRIVTLKGGRIWLESEQGKGTMVRVELPR